MPLLQPLCQAPTAPRHDRVQAPAPHASLPTRLPSLGRLGLPYPGPCGQPGAQSGPPAPCRGQQDDVSPPPSVSGMGSSGARRWEDSGEAEPFLPMPQDCPALWICHRLSSASALACLRRSAWPCAGGNQGLMDHRPPCWPPARREVRGVTGHHPRCSWSIPGGWGGEGSAQPLTFSTVMFQAKLSSAFCSLRPLSPSLASMRCSSLCKSIPAQAGASLSAQGRPPPTMDGDRAGGTPSTGV